MSATNERVLTDNQKDRTLEKGLHVCNANTLKNVQKVDAQKVKEKEIRQSELRKKEQKLRKKEEDLKIKEKLINEMDSERIWFKTHIQKLELKINELEKSNNILRNQVGADHTHNQPNLNENFMRTDSNTNSLVQRIQERVSNIVLKQVEAQFERVERLMNEQTLGIDITEEGFDMCKRKEQDSRICMKHMSIRTQTEDDCDNDCFITSETLPLHNGLNDLKTSEKSLTGNVTGEPLFHSPNQYDAGMVNRHLVQKVNCASNQKKTPLRSEQRLVKKHTEPKSLSRSNLKTKYDSNSSNGKIGQTSNKVSELYEQLITKSNHESVIKEQDSNKAFLWNRPDRPQTR